NRIFGHISKHRDLQHAKETLSAHSEIVKAIEQRDADTAYNCIYSHIKLSLNEALEVLDDQFYEDNF
ncbi:MAG: FCD domain-containing protein, partial [Calditrichaeota bacterium]